MVAGERRIIAAAQAEVIGLADGSRKWRMCVPVHNEDSDVVLMEAIDLAERLLNEAESRDGRAREEG